MPINYDIDYPVLLRKYHELCNEFCGQRDTALKLADDWDGRVIAGYVCADELRAIFEPKEGK